MKNASQYKNDASEAIHSAVTGMYRAGTIDSATMERFDESCLVPALAAKSDLYQAIHDSASALYKIGAIDAAGMKEFDEFCMTVRAPIKRRKKRTSAAKAAMSQKQVCGTAEAVPLSKTKFGASLGQIGE